MYARRSGSECLRGARYAQVPAAWARYAVLVLSEAKTGWKNSGELTVSPQNAATSTRCGDRAQDGVQSFVWRGRSENLRKTMGKTWPEKRAEELGAEKLGKAGRKTEPEKHSVKLGKLGGKTPQSGPKTSRCKSAWGLFEVAIPWRAPP